MAENVKHITASVYLIVEVLSLQPGWVISLLPCAKYSSQFEEALYNTLPVPTTLQYQIYVKEPGPYLFGGN